MQPILAATDFSAAAENALLYAASLATRLGSPLTIMNVYSFPVMPTSEPGMMMPYEEFHQLSVEGLEKNASLLRDKFPDLQLDVRSAAGDAVDQINEECEKIDPLLIIVGSRESQQTGLFGSTTTAIVKDCAYPVLCVPANFRSARPSKAILATDLSPISAKAAGHLRSIVAALQLELHLLHVVKKEEGKIREEEVKNSLGDIRADVTTIVSDDLTEGIEIHAEELGADLVITVPHSYSWLDSLFVKRHTRDLVTSLRIPLLCIPEASS